MVCAAREGEAPMSADAGIIVIFLLLWLVAHSSDEPTSTVEHTPRDDSAKPPTHKYAEPCCANEKRDFNGGCVNCGDPCI